MHHFIPSIEALPDHDVANWRVRDDVAGKRTVVNPRSKYKGVPGRAPTVHVEDCWWLHHRGPQRQFDTPVDPWTTDLHVTLLIEQHLARTHNLRFALVCPCWATREAR